LVRALHPSAPSIQISLGPEAYSKDRDGIDGSWSTFTVQLGSPPQAVRVLPSITGDCIWAVLPQACQKSAISTCRSDRGGVFTSNQSSTWEDKGLFQLPLNPEHYLPFSGAADIGFDNVTLDWQGYGGLALKHQVIAGYITDDFYLGTVGLSPFAVNITSFDDQYPSILGTLRAENHIPSSTYGYTAGASYRTYPDRAFGSLTIGGYDSTRMDMTRNLTMVAGSDTYRPMLLGIEKITSGSTELLDAPIIAGLNSIISHLWLPISACQRFESVFGLVWNSTYELYIVNETQHSALLAQDASITFTLSAGTEQKKDDRLNITLPYAAFDLTAKPPYAGLNESVHYFPLKQAANNTQYILGRTFLQETYMIADYDRPALSLFPALFPDASLPLHLVTIFPPEDVAGKKGNHLSRATTVGIIAGGIILVLLLAGGAFFCLRRHWPKRTRKSISEVSNYGDKPELAGNGIFGGELEDTATANVQHDGTPSTDLRSRERPQVSFAILPPLLEMSGDHGRSELDCQGQIYELPSHDEI
jgi:Eukaryotic aspartyl protease